MSTVRKSTSPVTPAETPVDIDRANAALRASQIDYQIDGELDVKAYARAISKRFPKIMASLA